MSKTEYLEFHKECLARMHKITAAKNADYCGANPSPFANFERCERNGYVTTEQGFLVRLDDKFARIQSFIQQGTYQVKDESFEDTCLDAANYLILLAGYMRKKNGSEKEG